VLAGVLAALAVPGAALAAPATRPAAAPAATAPATRAPGGAPYPAAAVCVDTARALPAGSCARITQVLDADEKASRQRDEIAVAVVPTTGGARIESWSTGLFNAWGVGQAGTDNGVLLVVALQDRALRITTGDGLRTRLPDYRASEIIGSTITPLLRQGRTEDAVLAGLDAVRTELGHDVAARPLAAPGTTAGLDADPFATEPAGEGGSSTPWLALLCLLVVAGIVLAVFSAAASGGTGWATSGRSYSTRRPFSSSSSRRSSSSSSSSSSRRSSFGGGRSSGGGASGRW
jgi:uncharacterized protein